jgi:DnaJ-domain-containing protein 1
MIDYFVLLKERRRPWLEPGALKAKFLALAAEAHPDKQQIESEAQKLAVSRHYAELNAAYHCLAEPKSRLFHLLELEQGAKPADIQQIPDTLAELFAAVAMTCRNTDTFLKANHQATSPLLQVQQFERSQEWVEQLRNLQARLAGLHHKLVEELKQLDASWMSATSDRTVLLNRLEELYRLFGYFNRWNSQIQERIVQLSL